MQVWSGGSSVPLIFLPACLKLGDMEELLQRERGERFTCMSFLPLALLPVHSYARLLRSRPFRVE